MSKKRIFPRIFIGLAACTLAVSLSGCALLSVPATASIIENANISSNVTNAAILDDACKTYYAGVISGSITRDNVPYQISDELPDSSASIQERKQAAQNLTIRGAVLYSGIQDTFTDDNSLNDFGVLLDGTTVYLKDEHYVNKSDSYFNLKVITFSTTLGELYGP